MWVEKSTVSDCHSVTRVRLSEGFHFASSGDGIINMVLELPIQVSLGTVCERSPSLLLLKWIHLPVVGFLICF